MHNQYPKFITSTLSLLTIIFFSVFYSSYAQVVETVSVEFVKVSTRDLLSDTVRGRIFYGHGKTVLKIFYPLEQWMELKGGSTLIYYPKEGKAIRLVSESLAQLSFLQSFLGFGDHSNYFERIGFILAKTEFRGDTLISYWSPAKPQKGQKAQFILKEGKNRLYSSEFRDEKRQLFYRTHYDQFFAFGKNQIPLQVNSWYQWGREKRQELIIFGHPEINRDIPQEILDFALPSGTKVEEITW